MTSVEDECRGQMWRMSVEDDDCGGRRVWRTNVEDDCGGRVWRMTIVEDNECGGR